MKSKTKRQSKPSKSAGANGGSAPLLGERPEWKIHTSNLLSEIVKHSGQDIYRIPLSILGQLLAAVGERASELNDPKLNALMCRLTIYTIADPTSLDYDLDAVRAVMSSANPRAIQLAMGHSQLETTMGYFHAEALSVKSPLDL